ncbi:MAG: chromate transporter [Clostridiales bacterium]|nr:chromate transporter [Clostridiales bacterium]
MKEDERLQPKHPVQSRGKVILTLFTSMLSISAFTFGGGFVIVSLMKKKFVGQLGWLDEGEMLDLTAIAQTAPGPIAVNAAVLVGWRMGGFLGMLAAVLGTILPPMAVLLALSACYERFAENRYVALMLKGMQAGVAAVILDVVWGLAGKVVGSRSALRIGLMVAAFVAAYFFKVNVILIILAAVLLSLVASLIQQRREKHAA